MGRNWDKDRGGMLAWVNWLSEVMAEALRVMKPGACGVVWSLPRTCGWTQLALEMSGFRVVDSIAILNGAGFPKGQDLGKMIDREMGTEGDREVVGIGLHAAYRQSQPYGQGAKQDGAIDQRLVTAPASPEAAQWDGWKTPALKPAHETWFLVQKPISESSIARNVLTWGVGGLNIEAARIDTNGEQRPKLTNELSASGLSGVGGAHTFGSFAVRGSKGIGTTTQGRYPANTILRCAPECDGSDHAPHCPIELLNRQTDDARASKSAKPGQGISITAMFGSAKGFNRQDYDDAGNGNNAARYFKQLPHEPDTFRYFTKASNSDRTMGGEAVNPHPTVKNRHLMEYFCKLLCPPSGLVLDPFGGSGSTALGALMAGMNYLLIEQDAEFVEVINQRISLWLGQNGRLPLEERLAQLEQQVRKQGDEIAKIQERQQLSLFDQGAA